MGWMTRYKEKSKQKDKSTTKTSHKINYRRVHPPTLQLESELRSCTFTIWKKQWLDFYEKSNMYESEGLAFLKEFSVPDPHYKELSSQIKAQIIGFWLSIFVGYRLSKKIMTSNIS